MTNKARSSRSRDFDGPRPPGLLRRSVVYTAMALTALPPATWAAPLSLSTAPAGTSFKLPAPNVILTLDDSGSMSGAGITSLKQALATTFTEANVPSGSIRLGWNAMNRCRSLASDSDGGCNGRNKVRVLDAAHRSSFLNWVSGSLYAYGGTPTHAAYKAVGDYYQATASADGPWASVPGATLEPVLSCRKSYSLLMTDGGWNHSDNIAVGGGNADGVRRTLGDGVTVYDPTSDNTRIYRDSWGIATRSTMADLAFHYWATDLQPTVPNAVKPKVREAGARTFTSAGTSKTIPEFWNPQNDPATWQHLTTYTIGFGDAATWDAVAAAPPGAPARPGGATYAPFDGRPRWGGDTWSGDFPALMVGTSAWADPITDVNISLWVGDYFDQIRRTEMWHTAINGRGKFVPAKTSDDLVAAFKDILNEIQIDQTQPVTSMAGSSRTTRSASTEYSAGYKGADWSGSIEAYPVAAGGGVAPVATWNSARCWMHRRSCPQTGRCFRKKRKAAREAPSNGNGPISRQSKKP